MFSIFKIFKKKKIVPHIRLSGVIGSVGRFKQGINFDGQERRGKNIIIKSDNIFISGDSVNINSKSGQTIKMGNPSLPMKPTVRGDVLLQFQSDIITILNDIQQILAVPNPAAISAKAVTLIPKIKRVVETVTKQKFLNKDILAS